MGVLGAGALTACTRGGGGRGTSSTEAPTGGDLAEPDTPLVMGSIGASYGRSAPFESAISIAIHEALVAVNARWKGLFGHTVEMAERHVMAEAGEDLTAVIAAMAESGVTAVITSIDEEALVAAMPAFVEAGMAVIDVLTSGMSVRAPDVLTSNMLIRLAPNDVAIATLYTEAAWAGSGSKGGAPGTVAYVSEDTDQGHSLLHEISQILDPAGGKVVAEHFHPFGKIEELDAVVAKVLKTPPALLVVNSGPEAGPFLSALYAATLDKDKRPTVEIPTRLGPAASVDYVDAELLPECLSSATGYVPGTDLQVDHVNMMLNVDPNLQRTGYAYSQQGYDAVMLACLAAQDALSADGVDISASVGKVLTGSQECTDFGDCRSILRAGLGADERATITITGRVGALELGTAKDARTGDIRTFTWSDSQEIQNGTSENFDAGS